MCNPWADGARLSWILINTKLVSSLNTIGAVQCAHLSFPSSQPPFLFLHISSYTELWTSSLPVYIKLFLFSISHVSLSLYIPTELDVYLLSSYEVPIYLSFPQRKGAVHFLSSQFPFSSLKSSLSTYLFSPKLLYTVYVSLSFKHHHVLCTSFLLFY